MSHPADGELVNLQKFAEELREVFAERGYRIDRALAADRAFGSRRSMSALTRDLALQAVGRACGTAAIDFRPVNGEGREIRFLSTIDRRYRVLRGQRSRRGDLVVKVNSDSALAIEDAGLFEAEVWAFVMIIENEHHTVVETVAAEILGKTDGSPGQLIFGEQIILGGGGFADGTGVDIRFTPDDGGDLGDFFGDEEDDDGVGFGNTSG